MKRYCYYCDEDVEYTVREEEISDNIRGIEINFIGQIAYCNKCGNEIYIPELDDENIKKANAEYRKKAGIITTEEIENILTTYDISAKTLAKLLGWGEATIERYLKGITPLKLYSDELKKLQNPVYMKKLYESNKDCLGNQVRKKIEAALEKICSKKTVSVFDVAKYFLSKADVKEGSILTPLKLQKLIYYAQGWHLAFFGKPLFVTPLEAWVHGPVSPEIWYKYQNYDYLAKEDFDPSKVFDIEQIQLLNEIYNIYGMFDAWVLRDMTHKDKPWREARRGYEENEPSSEVIPQESIRKYFENLKETLDIRDFKDIRKSLMIYRDILGIS
ncbi:MAG: hypothetical protein PWP45_610 [Tepidanaerobacteraceae bacterium]|uniref:Antitoxin SocA-like Panacea domain-containing protein n=1 Tax=Fervidicola ferrireducens TaxID=520764 RepID=A0A140LE91_9FIRM|nr:type II TA system antitoxin MqsA family protein [Fervidicola ferrireducens]KXG78866.1 hypothetical protein AN618_02040 [Fervidicola ferrireducens]MDN5331385.1 hypothetical protein [Tepidanaerobacteraceae bacterium]